MRAILATILLCTFWAAAAFGWGNPGHMTVCQIAYLRLTPVARAEVDRLVPLGPLGMSGRNHMTQPYASFAKACTFPDNPHTRAVEHYVNYDRGLRQITAADLCAAGSRCIYTAIDSEIATLSSPMATDADKARALFYLGHWVGDLHQPLHVSFEDDHGGGWIDTTGACPGDNLHAVWDKCIVEQLFQTLTVNGHRLPRTTPQNQDDNARLAAGVLNSRIIAPNAARWKRAVPWEWSREGYRVTQSPAVGYCVRRARECWYDSSNRVYSGGATGAKRSVAVDQAYLNRYAPTVAVRLEQAGVRLAHQLNRLFDPACRASAAPSRC
jgi:hypothetical protein